MKRKILLLLLIISFVGFGQQKDNHKKDINAEKINQEIKNFPAPLTPILPEYPKVAKLAGIQGKVFVQATIDEKGNVAETKILKSEQETLNASAIEAIKKTKFTPAVSKQNKKVKATVVIPINFKLDDKSNVPDVGVTPEPPADISDPDINATVEVEKLPALIETGKPIYPEEAKKNNISGKVYVKILVSKDGSPKKAVVIKTENEIFNQSAVDAAMKCKFSPALQKGNPVAVWIVLPYKFALDGKEMPNYGEYSTTEEAKKTYASLINLSDNPDKAEALGVPKGIKSEKLDTDIKYGDESAVYKGIFKGKEGYVFYARKDKVVYRHISKTLEEIRGYVEGLKNKDK